MPVEQIGLWLQTELKKMQRLAEEQQQRLICQSHPDTPDFV